MDRGLVTGATVVRVGLERVSVSEGGSGVWWWS